jgi:hypothetical protein
LDEERKAVKYHGFIQSKEYLVAFGANKGEAGLSELGCLSLGSTGGQTHNRKKDTAEGRRVH